ncbi:MAG: gliding motility lipoprotein GldH [Flavobacteriaceae bacterium]|nr:gliding motility lipoprotein GldH [Bacteroidia bacterium]NNK88343.1 gliding motility lipoprotein GldH [Flavobacteriaceae bacterium]
MQNKILYLTVMSLMLASCDSEQLYDEYRSIDGGWDKNDVVEFKITPPDTVNPYNLFINLRNTSDYRYSNLFLIVEMNHPNGKVKKDTLEYKMTNPDGSFMGSGFTDIKENKLWYKEAEIFTESGEYIINIGQAMRENGQVNGIQVLEGIIDVGLRIERPNTTN